MTAPAPPPIAWSAPPLIGGSWRELLPEEALQVMVRLCAESAAARAICANHTITRLRMRRLEAIRDGLLIEFLAAPDSGEPARIGACIYRPSLFDLLTGESAVLHQINDEGDVVLDTPAQAIEYALLFCAALQGESGSFAPVEGDTAITQMPDHPDLARSLADFALPVVAEAADGGWQITITIAYGAQLFRSQLHLHRSGMMDMQSDRHLCGIAPVMVAGWSGHLRTLGPAPAIEAQAHPCPVCEDRAADGEGEDLPSDDDVPF